MNRWPGGQGNGKQSSWAGERREKEHRLKELSDIIKHNNTHIIRIPEREKKEKGTENLFKEIIAENFPNLGKGTEIEIQEAQRAPKNINPRRSTRRHIVIKTSESHDEERFLKVAREKKILTYKGNPIRLWAGFSAKTLQVRREWCDIFQVQKDKKPTTSNTLFIRLSITIEEETKSFLDKQKSKEFMTTKPTLKKMFKGTHSGKERP